MDLTHFTVWSKIGEVFSYIGPALLDLIPGLEPLGAALTAARIGLQAGIKAGIKSGVKAGVKEGKKQAKDALGKDTAQSSPNWKQENTQQVKEANQHKDSIVNDFTTKQQTIAAGLKRRDLDRLIGENLLHRISLKRRRLQLLDAIWDDHALDKERPSGSFRARW